MRSSWKTLAAVATSLLLVPQLAAATTDVEDQLRQMQDRMNRLEDSLQSTNDQLSAANATVADQQVLIERAGLEERDSQSSLSKFLSDTEFSGAVAASYSYNFNNPENVPTFPRATSGVSGFLGGFGQAQISRPFHKDANQFQFDEFSLSMSREATSDMPAGFGVDLVFGETADVMSGEFNGAGNSVWVRQAYVSWMTPIGPSITLGKFDTAIGYETAGAAENFNIARGFTYTQLQNVSQIGAKLHDEYDSGLYWMIGVANGFAPNQPDIDKEKDIIWALGWSSDMLSVQVAGDYGWDIESVAPLAFVGGNNVLQSGDDRLVLDFIAELTPSDAFTAWVNVTSQQLFLDSRFQGGNNGINQGNFPAARTGNAAGKRPWAVGINVGGHVAFIPDKLGLALRYEYLTASADISSFFDRGGPGVFAGVLVAGPLNVDRVEAHGITATVDYSVTENMTMKAEVTWERAYVHGGCGGSPEGGCGFKAFPQNGFGKDGHSDQVIVGAQMVYEF